MCTPQQYYGWSVTSNGGLWAAVSGSATVSFVLVRLTARCVVSLATWRASVVCLGLKPVSRARCGPLQVVPQQPAHVRCGHRTGRGVLACSRAMERGVKRPANARSCRRWGRHSFVAAGDVHVLAAGGSTSVRLRGHDDDVQQPGSSRQAGTCGSGQPHPSVVAVWH